MFYVFLDPCNYMYLSLIVIMLFVNFNKLVLCIFQSTHFFIFIKAVVMVVVLVVVVVLLLVVVVVVHIKTVFFNPLTLSFS